MSSRMRHIQPCPLQAGNNLKHFNNAEIVLEISSWNIFSATQLCTKIAAPMLSCFIRSGNHEWYCYHPPARAEQQLLASLASLAAILCLPALRSYMTTLLPLYKRTLLLGRSNCYCSVKTFCKQAMISTFKDINVVDGVIFKWELNYYQCYTVQIKLIQTYEVHLYTHKQVCTYIV